MAVRWGTRNRLSSSLRVIPTLPKPAPGAHRFHMNPWRCWKALVVVGCWFGFLDTLLEAAPPLLVPVGVSRIDISPTNAVPLMGYAARSGLPAPTNLAQRLHARALAIGSRKQAAVLVTIDNCILPGAITEEIRSRLARRVGLAPAQVA